MVISNDLFLQWGKYYTNTTDTTQFPIAYNVVPLIVAQTNSTHTDTLAVNRFPHTITTTQFKHNKSTTTVSISWLSIGY